MLWARGNESPARIELVNSQQTSMLSKFNLLTIQELSNGFVWEGRKSKPCATAPAALMSQELPRLYFPGWSQPRSEHPLRPHQGRALASLQPSSGRGGHLLPLIPGAVSN